MKRRGFTLIELVVSLSVVGILVTAIGSTIVVATRSLPTSGGYAETQASVGRTLMVLGEDVRLATSASVSNARDLTLTVPDRTGDDNEETIVYSWSATGGAPFVRTFNGESHDVIGSINTINMTAIKRSSIDTDGRTSTPSDRIKIALRTQHAQPVIATAEFRLFNTRLP